MLMEDIIQTQTLNRTDVYKVIETILIGNQQIIREGIKSVLESNSMVKVVGAGDSYQIIELCEKHKPDIVIVEIDNQMEQINDIIHSVEITSPNSNILLMFDQIEPNVIKEIVKMKVSGYISNKSSADELMNAVECLSKGNSYLSPLISNVFLNEFRELVNTRGTGVFVQLVVRTPFHLLTKRECDVLQLLTDGLTNNGIAESLLISPTTVKNYVSSILSKMKVQDRTQAVLMAIKEGWVHLN
jgi:two-component system response regulator DegU